MTTTDEARNHLTTAQAQLENYYNDPNEPGHWPEQTEQDRATSMREAEVNALVGIGLALCSLVDQLENAGQPAGGPTP